MLVRKRKVRIEIEHTHVLLTSGTGSLHDTLAPETLLDPAGSATAAPSSPAASTAQLGIPLPPPPVEGK